MQSDIEGAGMMRMRSGGLHGWRGPVPPLADVLVSLGRLPRFTGNTTRYYTVLQHSYLCHLIGLHWLELAPELVETVPRLALQCLLHDFAECLIGDIPAPFKPAGFREPERRFVELCARGWGLGELYGPGAWESVHMVDEVALHIEGHALTAGEWRALPERHLLERVLEVQHHPDGGALHYAVGEIIASEKVRG